MDYSQKNIFEELFKNDKLESMSLYEFVNYVKNHPKMFINYCEIIIGKYGEIYLVKPSHSTTAIQIASKYNKIAISEYKESIPKECSILHWIISKENIVAVWYNDIIGPSKLNRFQKRTITILKQKDIIYKHARIDTSTEYQRYLWRQSLYNKT